MIHIITNGAQLQEVVNATLKEQGMTRNQLGNAMGGDPVKAYRMTNPTLNNLLSACKALGLTLCITDTPTLYAQGNY